MAIGRSQMKKQVSKPKGKKKGADGKACWKGYRFAGTKGGKDRCVPVKRKKSSSRGKK
jgi:hypothetical protein|tara:strand:+ start:699 stop:872 length:174 start_codon:yes stop_codon:yes gene_type:complete